MKKLKDVQAFTLLEVLIVIAIIIIIAGIALPRFLGVSEQGRKARSVGDLRVLQTAIEAYVIQSNSAPGNGDTAYSALINNTPPIITNKNDFMDPFSANQASNYIIKSVRNTANGKVFYVAASVGANSDGSQVSIDDTGKLTKDSDDIVASNNMT